MPIIKTKLKYRLFSLAVLGCLMLNNATVAVGANASGEEYIQRVQQVSSQTITLADGVTYTKSVLQDKKYGPQRTYKIEFTPGASSSIEFALGDTLYRAKSLQTLMDSVKTDEKTPVGAINADFFNMSTGVPVSAFINNGILYTTDLNNVCFAIDKDGNAFFGKPEIKINMKYKGTDNLVIIMNKEYVNYSMCLYTDVYSDTTKIKNASTELVLVPYSQKSTPEEMALAMMDSHTLPDDFYVEVEKHDEDNDEQQAPIEDQEVQETTPEENTEQTQIDESQKPVTESSTKPIINKNPEPDPEPQTETSTEPEPQPQPDPTEPDPQSEEKYETVVNPIYLEELDEYAKDNGYTKYGENYFLSEKAAPVMGQSQKAVVAEIRVNPENGGVHDIPKGAYVLASDNKAYGHMIAKYAVGEEVEFSFSGNEEFYDVEKAIGTGCIILKDGEYVENTDVSHYKTAQPRSAVGITADGRIVLFAVDGRQSDVSAGMRLEDLAQEMLKAGCVDAANLDGGGSTAVKAYLAFNDSVSTVNKPSESSERRVANAIVVTNNEKPTGIPYYSYLNDYGVYVLPNGDVSIGTPYYTDENHYGVSHEKVTDGYFTYHAGQNGTVSDGTYFPMGYVGNAQIYSVNKDGVENVAANIISTDVVDNITVTGDVNEIYVGQAVDFSASSTRLGYKVYGDDVAYSWSVDPQYGSIIENGLFLSGGNAGDVEITASVGDTKGVFSLKVKELPFKDIQEHWSVLEVCDLYDEGVVVGENTPDGAMFFPDRTYSRNEFCVMLSRILGFTQPPEITENVEETENIEEPENIEETENTEKVENVEETETSIQDTAAEDTQKTQDALDETLQQPEEEVVPPMDFADSTAIPKWAYDSVFALYDKGLLYDFAHSGMMFDGQMPVTRREVISVIGRLCKQAPEDFEIDFADVPKDSSDYGYIKNAIYAGIFEGYEDGTLRVERNLTRAEGAAVFTRLLEYLDSTNTEKQ